MSNRTLYSYNHHLANKERDNLNSKRYYWSHRQQILDKCAVWRKEHPDKVRATNKLYLRKLAGLECRHLRKVKAIVCYSNPQGSIICNNCGEQDIDVLCIDHIIGGGGKHRRELNAYGGGFYRHLENQSYPVGYQVLCYNCNTKKSRFFSA